jgi:3-oxoacyl-[acyl-carrier protein] reductase
MELQDRVALVTGGGTGLGHEITLTLARQGMHLAINYFGFENEARQTAAQVELLGRTARVYEADVSSDSLVRAMVDQVVQDFGKLDVLVNCAGFTKVVPMNDLEGMDEAVWDRILAVNTKGPFLTARAAAPHMQRQGAGRIINITSTSGLRPGGSSIAYAVSKAGNQMLMRCLAGALGPTITVNAIAPGLMDTGWGRMLGDAGREFALKESRLKRLPALNDIADAAVFLIRNESMTGQTIIVDGGRFLPL